MKNKIEKIKYLFYIVFIEFKSNIFINIVIINTLFLSLLFPIIITCIFNFQINNLEVNKYKNLENILKIDYEYKDNYNQNSTTNIKIIDDETKKIQIDNLDFVETTFYYFSKIGTAKNNISLVDILAVGSNFNKIYELDLIEVESQYVNNEKDCLISTTINKKLFNNNGLGEKIAINNKEFIVNGIYKSQKDFDIIIPFNVISSDFYFKNPSQIISYFVFDSNENNSQNQNNLKDILSYKKSLEQYEIQITDGKNYYLEQMDLLKNHQKLFSIISIIILTYSILNIINIYLGKAQENIKKHYVKKVFGASFFVLFTQMFLEIFILSLISSLIIIFTFPILKTIFASIDIFIVIDKTIFLILYITCFLLSLIISLLLNMKIFFKSNIREFN